MWRVLKISTGVWLRVSFNFMIWAQELAEIWHIWKAWFGTLGLCLQAGTIMDTRECKHQRERESGHCECIIHFCCSGFCSCPLMCRCRDMCAQDAPVGVLCRLMGLGTPVNDIPATMHCIPPFTLSIWTTFLTLLGMGIIVGSFLPVLWFDFGNTGVCVSRISATPRKRPSCGKLNPAISLNDSKSGHVSPEHWPAGICPFNPALHTVAHSITLAKWGRFLAHALTGLTQHQARWTSSSPSMSWNLNQWSFLLCIFDKETLQQHFPVWLAFTLAAL